MKFRKFSGVLALLVAATLAFAFKPMEKAKKFDCVWFQYNGPQRASLSDAHNPANYSRVTGLPVDCTNGDKLCAICVDPSEIYANDPGTSDDTPMVDVGPTNPTAAYTLIETQHSFPNSVDTWTAKSTGTPQLATKP